MAAQPGIFALVCDRFLSTSSARLMFDSACVFIIIIITLLSSLQSVREVFGSASGASLTPEVVAQIIGWCCNVGRF
jgi:hypothetical protein